MKKICSMLLACMMILTEISMPTFAINGGDIVNLSKKEIEELTNKVDSTFAREIKNEYSYDEDSFDKGFYGNDFYDEDSYCDDDFYYDRVDLLDGICCSNLPAKYYEAKENQEICKEYLAKMYVLAGELVCSCLPYPIKDIKSLDLFKLEFYFLDKACECVGEDHPNVDLHSTLTKRYDFINEKLLAAIKLGKFYKNGEIDKNICREIYNNAPKNKEQFTTLLNNIKDIFNHCEAFLNGKLFNINDKVTREELNKLKDDKNMSADSCDDCMDDLESIVNILGPDKCICSLTIDENGEYTLKDIVISILKENFEFGPGNTHIAFGIFMDN